MKIGLLLGYVCAASLPAACFGQSWETGFFDDFDTPTLNLSQWFVTPARLPGLRGELQRLPLIQNGTLILPAGKNAGQASYGTTLLTGTPISFQSFGGHCNSTDDLLHFRPPCRISVRVKCKPVKGAYFSVIAAGNYRAKPDDPGTITVLELDSIEQGYKLSPDWYINAAHKFHITPAGVFGQDPNANFGEGSGYTFPPYEGDNWHTYTMDWDYTSVRYLRDGVLTYSWNLAQKDPYRTLTTPTWLWLSYCPLKPGMAETKPSDTWPDFNSTATIDWVKYQRRNSAVRLIAPTYDDKSGSVTGAPLTHVSQYGYNDWLKFRWCDIGGLDRVTFRAARQEAGTVPMEIHRDSPAGPLLATCQIASTGNAIVYQDQTFSLNQIQKGTCTLYFVLKGTGCNLEWIEFSKNPVVQLLAGEFAAKSGTVTRSGDGVINFQANNWILFKGCDIDQLDQVTIRAARKDVENVPLEIHRDSLTGPLLATCNVAGTSSYSTYRDQTFDLAKVQNRGPCNLYFLLKSSGCNIERIEFKKSTLSFKAGEFDAKGGNVTKSGDFIGLPSLNDWICFNACPLGGLDLVTLRAATRNVGVTPLEIHRDSPTGPLLGICNVVSTGDNDVYQDQTFGMTNVPSAACNVYLVSKASGCNLASIEFKKSIIRLNADEFDDKSGSLKSTANGLAYVQANDWFMYQSCEVGGLDRVTFKAARQDPKPVPLEIHRDSPTGPLLATCSIASTGSYNTYQEQTFDLATVPSEACNVCFVLKGSGCNLDWIEFKKSTTRLKAASFDAKSGNVKGIGNYVGYFWINAWIKFNACPIQNLKKVTFRAARGDSGVAPVEIHRDSPTGPLLAKCNIASTGSYNTYQEQTFNLTSVQTGPCNLYFVLKQYGCNLEWIEFKK